MKTPIFQLKYEVDVTEDDTVVETTIRFDVYDDRESAAEAFKNNNIFSLLKQKCSSCGQRMMTLPYEYPSCASGHHTGRNFEGIRGIRVEGEHLPVGVISRREYWTKIERGTLPTQDYVWVESLGHTILIRRGHYTFNIPGHWTFSSEYGVWD